MCWYILYKMYVSIHIHIYICINVYVCMYVRMYVCTYGFDCVSGKFPHSSAISDQQTHLVLRSGILCNSADYLLLPGASDLGFWQQSAFCFLEPWGFGPGSEQASSKCAAGAFTSWLAQAWWLSGCLPKVRPSPSMTVYSANASRQEARKNKSLQWASQTQLDLLQSSWSATFAVNSCVRDTQCILDIFKGLRDLAATGPSLVFRGLVCSCKGCSL